MGNCVHNLRGSREPQRCPPPSPEPGSERQAGNFPVLEAAEHHSTGCEHLGKPVSNLNGPTAQLREVTFRIILHCVPESREKEKSLTLKSYPASVLELKESIQTEYSIPASCQRLYFESLLIGDDERLDSYWVRDGDTLHVRYNSEGDVEDVLEIIGSIKEMVPFLESIQPELSKGALSRELDVRISRSVNAAKVESLPSKYFWPCSTERADANRLLFNSNNGLELMHQLHVILLRQPWENNPPEMQKLEYTILSTLWILTAPSCIRTLVPLISGPMLDAVSQSLLRNDNAGWGDSLLRKVKHKAIETIYNLAEVPEYQLQIASNMRLLEQFIAVMLSPAYVSIGSPVTTASFLRLSYSPETHPYLTRPTIIKGVIEVCKFDHFWSMLPWNFTTMFFAQLGTSSPHLLRPEQTTTLYKFMRDFLEKADYGEVWEEELLSGYTWSTMVPSVKLAYFPYSIPNRTCSSATRTDMHSSDAETTRKLQELCVEAGIFSLQNMLSGAPAREILVEEGLVEYVTCLPWCTLPGSRAQERAADLVSALRQKMQLHPPRLGTLTRAKLAAWHFGLERVLQTTPKLLSEVYPVPVTVS